MIRKRDKVDIKGERFHKTFRKLKWRKTKNQLSFIFMGKFFERSQPLEKWCEISIIILDIMIAESHDFNLVRNCASFKSSCSGCFEYLKITV